MGWFTPSTKVKAKHILKSKTFWFNVLTLVVTTAGFMPAKYAVPVSVFGNVILRLLTNQACTLSTKE